MPTHVNSVPVVTHTSTTPQSPPPSTAPAILHSSDSPSFMSSPIASPLASEPHFSSPAVSPYLSSAAEDFPTQDLSEPPTLPIHPMTTRLKDGTRKSKPFPNYKLYFSSRHPLLALHTKASLANLPPTPTCFSQAAKSPHWQQAMQEEFDALQANKT
jgi:hypothetical protein